jgi:hypothetical protein
MSRVSRDQLKKIAPRGKKALRASIDALRASFPTDDFLAILNADLYDITNDASITTWMDQALHRFADTVAAMGRFGEYPAPPEWAYSVKGPTLFLAPLVLSQGAACSVADHILTHHRVGRRAKRDAMDALMAFEGFLTDPPRRARAGIDTETSVAALHSIEVSKAVLPRLLTIPDAWAVRLRRCPGPRCPARYFWNAHDRPAEGTYCSDACRKAHKRLSASADPK